MFLMVALSGFEPELSAPKADVVDRYTTGLYWQRSLKVYLRGFEKSRDPPVVTSWLTSLAID